MFLMTVPAVNFTVHFLSYCRVRWHYFKYVYLNGNPPRHPTRVAFTKYTGKTNDEAVTRIDFFKKSKLILLFSWQKVY